MDLRISHMTLRGRFDETSGVHAFLGVPYAQAPVGPLRWRPPQPIKSEQGLIDATHFGPVPAQPFQPHQRAISQQLFFTPFGPQSEDCLTLNVFTPTLDRGARLPVMMWIPGGGFRGGSSASPLYDGSQLAKLGVVLVSINYRVSRFGFLAHPWLTQESERQSSGNYGLLDQIAALAWIRDNIARFGGDPGAVTIFGQSAGSQSVVYLMCSPLAEGLFHRAIAQSGSPFSAPARPGVLGRNMLSLREAEAEGQGVAKALGARNIDDLRAASTQDIVQACPPEAFISSRPIIDGWVLPQRPEACFASGAFNDVPLICGTVDDEGTIFDCQWDAAEHRAFTARNLADVETDYARLYPACDAQGSRISATDAYGDRMYAWPSHALARAHSRQSRHGAFLYRFAVAPPCPPAEQADCPVTLGAFHGAELSFVFGNFYPTNWGWTQAHHDLSARMREIWTCFAQTGLPDATGIWPAFKPRGESLMHVSADEFEPRAATTPQSAFWDRLAGSNEGSSI